MSNGIMTEVRLLAVPFENDYQHTLFFNNETEQLNYFNSRVVETHTDFSYQRKDNVIRFPKHADSFLNCNYVMYRNSLSTTKWYYAFITDIEYINDGRTDVHIETDVIQTWMFNYTIKPSFVEREHVDKDNIGEHTVPEGLELGGYICNNHTKADYCDDDDMVIIVGVTKNPDGDNVRGTLYNNIYSGLKYYKFANTIAGATELQEWLDDYADDGASDAVICMFLAPKNIVSLGDSHTVSNSTSTSKYWINNSGSVNHNVTITNEHIDGYVPRNKKLLTYPYRYLLVSNNCGAGVVYHYELFSNTTNQPRFLIEGALSVGCSVRLIPYNYKRAGRNDEEGLNLGKFPALNWTSDIYTNWVTQNAVNIGLSIAGGVGQAVAGVGLMATGAGALAGAGTVASGAMSIASTLGEIYSHSLQPPQSEGNVNCGDVITASGQNDFHFYDMTIKVEYARIIDSYFDMYGYKVNRVKVPSFAHRENYWYTKTINVNIDGNVPMKDMQKIKECYNNGITFWINPANIGNYSVSNNLTG